MEFKLVLLFSAARGGRARVPSPTGLVHMLYGLNFPYGEGLVCPTTSSSARTTPSTAAGARPRAAELHQLKFLTAQHLRELNKCAVLVRANAVGNP